MIYFFVGNDNEAKDRNIADLKQKLFTNKDALQFDYELLHAHKLEPEILKKALLALPAIAKKRLIILREARQLRAHHKEIIEEVFRGKDHPCILILDYTEREADNAFVQKLKKCAKMFQFYRGAQADVFELGKTVVACKKIEALKMLTALLLKGDQPLQIIGALVWSWGKERNRLAPQRFKDGLRAFQEADVNIKRSRLKAEHAVEVLIVQLCSV